MTIPKEQLILEKRHDFCASKNPKITVVMIHGIASDSATFTNILEYLERIESLDGVRFVTFDLLGSGESLKDDSLNYDYNEQIKALDNSIKKLGSDTPLVLIGHSLGTFIVTRYASTHKKAVKKLILISPPVYTKQDLDNPAMKLAIQAFCEAVSKKNQEILKEKSFNNSIEKIVLNRDNYKTLSEITTPTVMIYGNSDQIIASFNYPKLLKENSEYLTATQTEGRHGIAKDKYDKVVKALEEVVDNL